MVPSKVEAKDSFNDETQENGDRKYKSETARAIIQEMEQQLAGNTAPSGRKPKRRFKRKHLTISGSKPFMEQFQKEYRVTRFRDFKLTPCTDENANNGFLDTCCLPTHITVKHLLSCKVPLTIEHFLCIHTHPNRIYFHCASFNQQNVLCFRLHQRIVLAMT